MEASKAPNPSPTQSIETSLDYLTCSEMYTNGRAPFIGSIRMIRKTAARIKKRRRPVFCAADRGASTGTIFAPPPESGSPQNSLGKTLAFDAHTEAPEDSDLLI